MSRVRRNGYLALQCPVNSFQRQSVGNRINDVTPHIIFEWARKIEDGKKVIRSRASSRVTCQADTSEWAFVISLHDRGVSTEYGYHFIPANAALRCHRSKADRSSRAAGDGMGGTDSEKYCPVVLATSGEEWR
jgi:hypothetical protein